MKKIINVIIYLTCLLFLQTGVYAQFFKAKTQSGFPEVGNPVPDFVLKNIKSYSKTQESNKTLEGQFYILNFYTKHCTSCIARFPLDNKIAQKIQW